jgi:uncharacterized protein (TIGR03066 family)
MNNRPISRRTRARRGDRSPIQPASNPPAATDPVRPPLLPRWLVLALCLLLAGGATGAVTAWAVSEGILFSKIPRDLVGKWVVQGGPQDGATFDFFRSGDMVARLNNNGTAVVLKARVAVEGKKLLTTTRNPHTDKDETNTSTIRELTRDSLVLETARGEVFRLSRAE